YLLRCFAFLDAYGADHPSDENVERRSRLFRHVGWEPTTPVSKEGEQKTSPALGLPGDGGPHNERPISSGMECPGPRMVRRAWIAAGRKTHPNKRLDGSP